MSGYFKDKKYGSDRAWTDALLYEIKTILGPCLLTEGSFEEDAKENTDLKVFNMKGTRIGCRVRTYEWFIKCPEQFTIRYSRPSGVATEIDKIMAGWGDLFFYGFANESKTKIIKWTVADLNVFRMYYANVKGKIFPVQSSHCEMQVFNWRDFPISMVVDSSILREILHPSYLYA